MSATAISPPIGALRRELAERGWTVIPQAASVQAVTAALRLLTLAIRRHGLTAEEIVTCQATTFFPQLRWEPPVWDVLPATAAELLGWVPGDDWAEPQLLIRFPDEDEPSAPVPHVDALPDWAPGGAYRGIVGVALTTAGERDGAPMVWPGSHRGGASSTPVPVCLEAGDALVMHPGLRHCGALNLGAQLRAAVYFRLVRDAVSHRSAAGARGLPPPEGG
jgi:hypothetical protein